MCGISGFLGDFSPDLIHKMTAIIKHRGPDGDGVFVDKENKISLGHTRLSIIDLSEAGHQPMVISSHIAMSYNGEIYNYKELRETLEIAGHKFRGDSDTEVLATAYIEYGTECFAKLNGIFSAAIWDMRLKKLFLTRDGMGVKPLYYASTSNGFIFSSELKAILCEPSIPKDLDPVASAQYLTYLWTPETRTMLKAVKKVVPGTFLEITASGTVKSTKFYTLPHGIPDNSISEDDAIEMVREGVRTAVERQMVADVEVGAFLSGGLDSSSIVAFANQATNKKLQCFTINANVQNDSVESMEDDLPYARKVAKELGVDLHEVSADPSMADRIPEMIYQLDEPQADPAILNALFICELAQSKGIKVLLSGAGGDDIFTGYRRHYALTLEKYWAWLPQFVRSGLGTTASSLPTNKNMLRKIRKAFSNAALTDDERIGSYFYWLDPDTSQSLLTQDYRQDMITSDILEPMLNSLAALPPEVPRLNKMLNLDSKYFLTDHNLNYTDKMGMACGVEVRVPLIDKDLVALAARLPTSLKQKGSEGKWVFKKAMEGILPHDVIYRPKTGFGAPLRQWLQGDFGEYMQDSIASEGFKKRGIFDPKAVNSLFKDTISGKIDGTYSLLSILCQEIWCQKFIDEKG